MVRRLTGIRRRLAEQDRKAEIIDAAIRVARQDGLDAMTARTVGAKAAISHGLVLHHFRSMRGLHSEMLDVILARTLVVQHLQPTDVRPGERLIIAFLRKQIAFFAEQRELVALIIDYRVKGASDATVQCRISQALTDFRNDLQPVIAEAIRADTERPVGIPVTGLSRLIGQFLLGNCIQRIVLVDDDSTELVLATIQALLFPAPAATSQAT